MSNAAGKASRRRAGDDLRWSPRAAANCGIVAEIECLDVGHEAVRTAAAVR